jgi:hypothetical protein
VQTSPSRQSRGNKKLLTTLSCQSISRHDNMQQRKQKNVQKNSSNKKRLSQASSHERKGRRGQSTEKLGEWANDVSRSSKSGCHTRSGKKRVAMQGTVYVKAIIEKVRSQIKA